MRKLIIKSLTNYKSKNLVLFISVNKGWFISRFNQYNSTLEALIFGYIRLYKLWFKLKGYGYKWKYLPISEKQNRFVLFFKLGLTHKIIFYLLINLKCKLRKKILTYKHRNTNFLRLKLQFFYYFYKRFLYNKKGIYIKGTYFLKKISKKKSKF